MIYTHWKQPVFEWQLPFLRSERIKKRLGAISREKTAPSQGLEGSTWQRNISLLAELHWKKLQASLITINSLLSACEKESQWLLALDFVILGSTLDGFPLFFTNFSFDLDDHGPTPLVHILSFWLHPSQICAYPLHIHLASICNN